MSAAKRRDRLQRVGLAAAVKRISAPQTESSRTRPGIQNPNRILSEQNSRGPQESRAAVRGIGPADGASGARAAARRPAPVGRVDIRAFGPGLGDPPLATTADSSGQLIITVMEWLGND